MGNLGPYQDITTLAKQLGGVENLIKTIESGAAKKAVRKAGPVLLAVGVLAGAGATKGLDAVNRRRANFKAGQAAAAAAKEQLKVVVEELMNSDDGEGPDEGGEKTTGQGIQLGGRGQRLRWPRR